LKDRLGDMPVKDVSNKHIYSLVMDLHKNNYSKSFINKSVQHFRSALKKSEQLCEIETHSSLKNTVSLPRAAPKKERFLSDREARRLRDFVHMNGEDEVVLLIGFLMYTGARRHEAMNSEWQHINLGDKDWYVPITKSGKPRHIVLNGKAIEIIQRAEKLQLKKHGHIMQWLFVNPQTHKPYRCIFHKWKEFAMNLTCRTCAFTICATALPARSSTTGQHSTRSKSSSDIRDQPPQSAMRILQTTDCSVLPV